MLGRQQPDEIKEIAGLALPGLGLVCLLQGHDLQTLKRQEMSVLPFPPPPASSMWRGCRMGCSKPIRFPGGSAEFTPWALGADKDGLAPGSVASWLVASFSEPQFPQS